MRHRGFTLVELLVVISIIAILAGLVTVGVGIAGKTKAKTKTQALMANVQADLTSFKTVNGWYPEETAPGLPAGATWDDAYGPVATPRSASQVDWIVAARNLIHQLNLMGASYKVDLNNPNDTGDLTDAWKQPLHYRPAKYYLFSVGAPIAIDGETPPSKDSYQLWSCGPDKLDQYGAPTGDDLTSWPK